MRFQTTRLTLTALLVLCIASALAFSHGPSAAADTLGLTVAEYTETTGNSDDDSPQSGQCPPHLPGTDMPAPLQAGSPGTPQRVLQVRHYLTRFPILPQGPPHRA